MVNPRIVETDGEWTYEEGCLSVPGLSWAITRPNRVHLVGFDLDGNEIDVETDEYEGRIFQHETRPPRRRPPRRAPDADQRREATPRPAPSAGSGRARAGPDGLAPLLDR